MKARWCLQGPDFQAKIASGACHSPTLHPLSRALIPQILASRFARKKKRSFQALDRSNAFASCGVRDGLQEDVPRVP